MMNTGAATAVCDLPEPMEAFTSTSDDSHGCSCCEDTPSSQVSHIAVQTALVCRVGGSVSVCRSRSLGRCLSVGLSVTDVLDVCLSTVYCCMGCGVIYCK